ncbi:MAG: PaaI family thioesterase [Deferrisomatales bacterium]|nr:PaaI family thioesterase [Deferrisomatales bacterium]
MSKAQRRAELLRSFNQIAPIARTFGMRLSFTDDDRAVVDLPYNPGLDHAMGGVHGGVYAALLDTAGWFAAAVAHGESSWIATSEMSIHFLKPSARTDLRAEGRILKRGKRQDVVEMHLYDGAEDLVGHGTGTMMVLPHLPFSPLEKKASPP